MIEQMNIDVIRNKRLNQEHLEIQLENLKSIYKKKILDILVLEKKVEDALNELSKIDQQIEAYVQDSQALQSVSDNLEIPLRDARVQISFENDYLNRKKYYQTACETVDADCFNEILSVNKNFNKIIISLDGMDFQLNRAIELMDDLAKQGYLCFHFGRDLENDVERLSENNYVYKSEVQLLKWLKSIDCVPIILVNSVQQTALLDLIYKKYIWYDICNNEDLMWGEQATSKLKHFDLLDEADMITYSDRKWKRYTLSRGDSMLWKPTEGCYERLINIDVWGAFNDDK